MTATSNSNKEDATSTLPASTLAGGFHLFSIPLCMRYLATPDFLSARTISRDFLAASKRKESWALNNRVQLICEDPKETEATFLKRILNAFRSCPNTIKFDISGVRSAIDARFSRDDQGFEEEATKEERDTEQAVANIPTKALLRVIAEGGEQADEIKEIRSHFAHLWLVSLTYANCDWTILALLLDFVARYSTSIDRVQFYEVPTLSRKSEFNTFASYLKDLSEEQKQLLEKIEALAPENRFSSQPKPAPVVNTRPLSATNLVLDLRVFNHDYKGEEEAESDLNGQCILEEGWTKTLQYFGQDLESLSFNSRGIYEPHMPYLVGQNFPKLKSLKITPGSVALSDYKYLATLSLESLTYGNGLPFEGLELLAGLKSSDPMLAIFDAMEDKFGGEEDAQDATNPPPSNPKHNLRNNLRQLSLHTASSIRSERDMRILNEFTHLQSLTLNGWIGGKPRFLLELKNMPDLREFNMYGLRPSLWCQKNEKGQMAMSQETRDSVKEWTTKYVPRVRLDFSFARESMQEEEEEEEQQEEATAEEEATAGKETANEEGEQEAE